MQKEKMTQQPKGFSLTSSIGFLNMNSQLGKNSITKPKSSIVSNQSESKQPDRDADFEAMKGSQNQRGSQNDRVVQNINSDGLSKQYKGDFTEETINSNAEETNNQRENLVQNRSNQDKETANNLNTQEDEDEQRIDDQEVNQIRDQRIEEEEKRNPVLRIMNMILSKAEIDENTMRLFLFR